MLQQTAQDYHTQRNSVLKEIETILQCFPFSARETLSDEQKTQAYLQQVKSRIAQADLEIAELKENIAHMIGENMHE